jgi:membrane protein
MRIFRLFRAAAAAWIDDYAPSMGAAIAYYSLFSIAPLLLLVIAVAGLVFGHAAAQGEIVEQLRGLMGEEGALAVQGLLESLNEPETGGVAAVVGAVTLLVGATTVLGELQSALDRIWEVPASAREGGILKWLRTRIISFGMILGLGFLLLVSLVVSAALAALGRWWGGALAGWDVVLQISNFVVSLVLITGVIAMIYRFLPRASIAWRDVWLGAAVTAVLFSIGKYLIGLYLGRSSVTSGFGAAGSLVVLLVWVYYSAQIFLFGAEFTWVYAHSRGSRRDPSGAEWVPARPKGRPRRSAQAAGEGTSATESAQDTEK